MRRGTCTANRPSIRDGASSAYPTRRAGQVNVVPLQQAARVLELDGEGVEVLQAGAEFAELDRHARRHGDAEDDEDAYFPFCAA